MKNKPVKTVGHLIQIYLNRSTNIRQNILDKDEIYHKNNNEEKVRLINNYKIGLPTVHRYQEFFVRLGLSDTVAEELHSLNRVHISKIVPENPYLVHHILIQ